jgi:hypothetical protein
MLFHAILVELQNADVCSDYQSGFLTFDLTCGSQTAQPAGERQVEPRVRLRPQQRLGSAVHVQRLRPPELLR